MSDPDFPCQAGMYYKGIQIKFYETLYQHYSNLDFSTMANRAVAMDGLESKNLHNLSDQRGIRGHGKVPAPEPVMAEPWVECHGPNFIRKKMIRNRPHGRGWL
jgi:hypothetical protein